jgi:hypothetical protein
MVSEINESLIINYHRGGFFLNTNIEILNSKQSRISKYKCFKIREHLVEITED